MHYPIIKLLFLIGALSLSILPINSQDSLQNLLQTNMPDTTRSDVLSELSALYRGINMDSSIMYAERATVLARNIDDKERLGYRLKDIGIGYYYKGDFVKTLEYWNESLATFEEIEDLKGVSNLLSNIGAVYNSTGDYPKSIDFHLRCLRIAEQNNDDFRRATALQNIGAVYSNMTEYNESQKYYVEALALCKELNYEKGIGIITMNLSEVYRNLGDFDNATIYTDEAVKIFTRLKDPSLPEAIIAVAELNNLQGNYTVAVQEAKKAYKLSKDGDSKVFMQTSLKTMGKAFLGVKNPIQARLAFRESIKYGQSLGAGIDLQEAYQGLKEANVQLGRYIEALEAQDSLLQVNKALYDIEKDQNIFNLELEFDLDKRESEIALLNADNEIKNQEIKQAELQRNFFTATSLLFLLLIGGVGYLYRYSQKKNKIINEEKEKSDSLLRNILPQETADELKKNGSVMPKRHENSTVLFTDFVGFTRIASQYSPEKLVSTIDYYFRHFDQIILDNKLEKIKTIGDAYMCAGGLHKDDHDPKVTAKNTINAAREMVQFIKQTAENPPEGIVPFELRVGIDSGPLVAGVVGQTKFQYDIWGDTVNVASRMETNSLPNKINVSENVYQQLKDSENFVERGAIDVKNKGMMNMYFYEN